MRLDFSNVEGQKDFEPIPSGRYLVEVTDYKEGEASENAKNPGATTISWALAVDGDKHPDYANRYVWENMTIVEASLWRLKAFLSACGFDVDGEVDFDPEEVLGSQLVIKVGVQKGRKDPRTGQEYDPRNTVRAFYPVDEA